MNPDEEAIVKEVGAAIKALNVALARAQGANLVVSVDYHSMETVGKRESFRNYFAEVSKQAFKVLARP